jgi:hypothetical protein
MNYAQSSPATKLKIGILFMLASFPLFLAPFVILFAPFLFLVGLLIYLDGLTQNQKWEKAKKQTAAAAESTKR